MVKKFKNIIILKSIFLRSYKDVIYRSYVVNQLQLKKSNIENSIKKHQTELKVLQDTIDNINDGMFNFCMNINLQNPQKHSAIQF